MQLPLRLRLKPSRTYLAFLASGHILAGVAVCFLRVPGPLRAGFILLLALLLMRQWHALSRRLPTLLLHADGRLELLEGGKVKLARVTNETVVWPWLVVLHLAVEHGEQSARRAWVLFPDALPPDGHRQLRLWLRWRPEPAAD